MTDFEYTDYSDDFDSSLVDDVYYNSNTKELVVDLNGQVYKYTGVPKSAFDQLVGASSVGREYTNFKRTYGPGEGLGGWWDMNYVRQLEPVAPTYSLGMPKNLTYASDAVVDGAPVSEGNGTSNTFNLYIENSAPVGIKYDMTVDFVVVGGNDAPRQYRVKAAFVNEAVEALENAAEALDITVRVKGVYVSFE